MGSAKEISVKVIPANIARPFVKAHHYSGKVVNNSKLHFGAFLNGKLHGVMSFGPPLDKSKVLGLVVDANGNPAPWNDMLELNRMAFDDVLPKNSESRAIAVAVRLIRKKAPNIKWVLSFADAGQCGDGTIYRASGFKLTGMSKCSIFSNGKETIQEASIRARGTKANKEALRLQYENKGGLLAAYLDAHNMKRIDGFSIRYIKILDPAYRLAVQELPYSTIQERGAGMYRGEKR